MMASVRRLKRLIFSLTIETIVYRQQKNTMTEAPSHTGLYRIGWFAVDHDVELCMDLAVIHSLPHPGCP